MINLTDLEKKINSELTTKIKKSEIRHQQLYIDIDCEDLIDVSLFIKNNENTKFRQLIDVTVVDYPEKTQRFKIVYLFLRKFPAAHFIDHELLLVNCFSNIL